MVTNKKILVIAFVCAFFLLACKHKDTLFTKLSHDKTNINFRNIVLEDDERFSCLNFPYYYNGGGTAIGDFNNDGLPDIVFTGSMSRNRLYVNKGNLSFEDVTDKAGIAKYEGWCTGVTVADVNEDGWLDIYICRSASESASYRTNLLFINNHDLTFTEKAAEYGLNDSGYSTQASFFDYDKDGDLDMFLIKQSKPEYAKGNYVTLHKQITEAAAPQFENKLYQNNNGHFTDVTHAAGISSNTLTFSLGVSTADINMDGYPDIYVSNDYNEEDYMYINNRNGTFTQQLKNSLDHVALYSMGCDVADYNNDLLPDICTLDMLSDKNYDLKLHHSADRFDKYEQFLSYGFYPFFMHNQLQKNNGDGTFSEVSRVAGIDATNWSWSVLFADYDLDGKKDIFITNGVKRDITNLEYMRFASDNSKRVAEGGEPVSFKDFLTHIPGDVTPHYLYKNEGRDKFQNVTEDYGLDESIVSNGAVYADLDNDGDLDLVTNNIDEEASIFRNNSDKKIPKNNFLQISFNGTKQNPLGVGAKLFLYLKDKTIYQEQLLTRGFQSSVDTRITIGLGEEGLIDSARVIWPDDSYQVLTNVKANQFIKLNRADAKLTFNYSQLASHGPSTFTEVQPAPLQYQHVENYENDFYTQPLMPHFYSHNGPAMAVADVNGDGKKDVFIGGAKGTAGKIFLQEYHGQYSPLAEASFKPDAGYEDVAAAFFDVDNDGDADLYLVSGGYEFDKNSPFLQDRLFINDGKGNFTLKTGALPTRLENKSCIAVCDMNNDGFADVFVGGGVVHGSYPLSSPGRIFMNDGKGNFIDKTKEVCPALLTLKGIISSAVWVDVNKDGKKDLVVAGEWMPVTTFVNNGTSLTLNPNKEPLPTGWWTSLAVADIDGDGDDDIIAGNFGLNTPLKTSSNEPVEIYYSDIDGNGVIDPFLSSYSEGKPWPFVGMDDANKQVPSLRKKFYEYTSYATAGIKDVYPSSVKLEDVPKMSAAELRTVYLENTGNGFAMHQLPVEAQYAPVYAICVQDVNNDGYKDVLLFGNNKYNRLRIGQLDANHGILLAGDGKGGFTYVPQYKSGLNVRADVRSATILDNKLVIGVNNGPVRVYQLNNMAKK